jgi:protein-S-isoprenylcysteine O-methyltransferase Ste14
MTTGARPDPARGLRMEAWHFAWRGWILAGMLAALAWARWRSPAPLAPAWLALLAAGLAWRAWAGFHIAEHSNGRAWAGPALAAAGPYRISRHPLYFANLLSAAGVLLFAHCLPGWAEALVLALVAIHHEALARSEEAFLLGAAGKGYLGYMQVTPRWPGFPAAGSAIPPRGGAETFVAGSFVAGTVGPAGAWRTTLARQGWNLAKGGACAAVIWLAAACR